MKEGWEERQVYFNLLGKGQLLQGASKFGQTALANGFPLSK
jgi:hypothetical protein